jgi:RimJ/RimL family protein N-acetyltransferase
MFPVLQPDALYTYLPTEPPASLELLQRRYDFLSGGKSPDRTEDWLNWILFLKEENRAIGFFQATVRPPGSCDIAYSIHPDFWRRGLVKEASFRLITHLFEVYDVPAMTAFIGHPGQGPTVAVPEAA